MQEQVIAALSPLFGKPASEVARHADIGRADVHAILQQLIHAGRVTAWEESGVQYYQLQEGQVSEKQEVASDEPVHVAGPPPGNESQGENTTESPPERGPRPAPKFGPLLPNPVRGAYRDGNRFVVRFERPISARAVSLSLADMRLLIDLYERLR